MPYVRLTIAKPRPGQEKELVSVLRKLTEFAAAQPGCVQAMVLEPHDSSGEYARISIFEDEDSAERVANTDHVLSLRSQLHLLCEPGHIERAFFSA